MSDIKIETLNKVYNEALNKPYLYHHFCFGGGSVKMLDIYTSEKIYACKYQGGDNWMTKACKDCKGSVACEPSLTKNEEFENRGMTKIYNNILKEANPPKRKPLPDGVLPMTDEELKYFQATFRYPEIDKIIFQENVLVIKYKIYDDYAIQFVHEILYLATLFDLEV